MCLLFILLHAACRQFYEGVQQEVKRAEGKYKCDDLMKYKDKFVYKGKNDT